MIYILHQKDHFQRITHFAPGTFSAGQTTEAQFVEVPAFPAETEVILPNLGSALALWIGKHMHKVNKVDVFGPQTLNGT